MSQTAVFTLKALIPTDDDPSAPASVDLSVSMAFGQKMDMELNYDAPVVDQVISLGTMGTAGVKALIIKSPIGGCSVKFNDDSTGKAIAVGSGGHVMVNPSAGWLTGLKVTTTGPAKVRIIALA